MKRLNKEIKLFLNENFNILYGSIEKNNPNVIYIIFNTYISPLKKCDDYSNEIDYIKKNIKKTVSKCPKINDSYHKNNIINLEMYENCISYGKKTFFHLEIFLKQKQTRSLKNIKNEIELICSDLLNKFSNIFSNECFEFYSKNYNKKTN